MVKKREVKRGHVISTVYLPSKNYVNFDIKRGKHPLREIFESSLAGSGYDVKILPKGQNLIENILFTFKTLLSSDLIIASQGVPIIVTSIVKAIFRKKQIFVHTWKVPDVKGNNQSVYDVFLRFLIRRSEIVIVNSKKQEKQIVKDYPKKKVLFLRYTVNSAYWNKKNESDSEFSNDISKRNYILTAGGNDRKEKLCMKVADELGYTYLRTTNNVRQYEKLKPLFSENKNHLLMKCLNDREMVKIYHNAKAVLLLTDTNTNPAGLTTMLEAMSCGALVICYDELANDYLMNKVDGIVIKDEQEKLIVTIVEKMNSTEVSRMKRNAIITARRIASAEEVAKVLNREIEKVDLYKDAR